MIVIANYTIYLAGGMQKFGKDSFKKAQEWRTMLQSELSKYSKKEVKIINPNDYFNFLDEPQYQSQKEVMEFDLNKVRNSDLIIVNFNDVYSLGTMSELAISYDRRIPILGLNAEEQELHPWQIEMCNRIFMDMDDLVSYTLAYYLD